MKKIRFGVIGCGSIANEYHLPALRRVEGAQLVWACDLIEERAQKAKDDFGFEKYTLDYHDILNDSSIDAVCIFTKIEMHATLCIEAAAAGKHIFSQKPFAYNIEEGRKIIRAVDEAGVKLTPSFMHSYMDGSIAARRIVEEGKIGEIRHIRMRNATKNPFDSAPGYGGCMMDIGCHGMDLIHTVAGSSIEEVFALHLSPRDEKRREEFGERANLNGVENTAILNYRLASGATVFHEVSGRRWRRPTALKWKSTVRRALSICTIPTAAISYIMAGIWTAIPARISTGRPPPSTRSSLGTFITRHLWTIC